MKDDDYTPHSPEEVIAERRNRLVWNAVVWVSVCAVFCVALVCLTAILVATLVPAVR